MPRPTYLLCVLALSYPSALVACDTAEGGDASSDVASRPDTPAQLLHRLRVVRSGDGDGLVTSTPAGIRCGADCEGDFPPGTEVALWATPSVGSNFGGWTEGCEAPFASSQVLTMDSDLTCGAVFATGKMLTVEVGDGGQVDSEPAGISCQGPDTCQAALPGGRPAILEAFSYPRWEFDQWGGDCAGTEPVTTVTMTVDRTCSASFRQTAAGLTVRVDGRGRVTGPLGLDCGPDASCGVVLELGQSVTLEAEASVGQRFVRWDGGCEGTDLTTTVAPTGDALCVARFGCEAGCRLLDPGGQRRHTQPPFGAANESGDGFGSALAVGDFNGDGFGDVVVGGPGENDGQGAIFVQLGGSGLLSNWSDNRRFLFPNSVGDVDRPGMNFGAALAVGDLNGDGRDELIVGAPGAEDGAGRVYVLFGAAANLKVSDAMIAHQGTLAGWGEVEAGNRFGAALATGDIDGDGFADLVVGVPGADGDRGAVAVAMGGPFGVSPTGGLYLQQGAGGPAPGNRFGHSLATGFFDGDQAMDLAVGAPGAAVGQVSGAGVVEVRFGGNSGAPADAFRSAALVLDQVKAGDTPESGDGFADVLAVGDFDGDGHDDLAVGTPSEDQASGLVSLLMGPLDGPVYGASYRQRDIVVGVDSEQAGDRFGAALVAADFNADGRVDLAVGAPGALSGAGRLALLPGHPDGVEPGQALTQGQLDDDVEPGDAFGSALAAGDLQRDGVVDLVVGAPHEGLGASANSGLVLSVPGVNPRPRLTLGPILGAMSDSSVKVWVRSSAPGPWEVRVEGPDGGSAVFSGPAIEAAQDNTSVVTVDGLDEATPYDYVVTLQGEEVHHGSFRTLPRAGSQTKTTIAFAADLHVRQQPFTAFDTIAGLGVDALILGGDNVYIDNPWVLPATADSFRTVYELTLGAPALRALMASVPVFSTWDDHEIINDWYPGLDDRYAEARAAFDRYMGAHNPEPVVGGGLYYTFSVGAAELFVLDTRSHRSPNTESDGPGKSMLGDTQRQALLDWLSTSSATFKVIVSSVPFHDWATTGNDAWSGLGAPSGGFVTERDAIFDFIRSGGIGGVVLLSGDQHWATVVAHPDPNINRGYTLYEMSPTPAAAFLRDMPNDIAGDPDVLFANDNSRFFGLIEIDAVASPPTLTFKVYSDEGDLPYSLVVPRTDLGP